MNQSFYTFQTTPDKTWYRCKIRYLFMVILLTTTLLTIGCNPSTKVEQLSKQNVTWEKDYNTALKKAASENKLILLDFYHPG